MSNCGSFREIPNRLMKLQRLGFRILATIGYLTICLAIGASIHWCWHRPVAGVQASFSLPEEEDFRLLIDSGEESEPTNPETEIHI